jgi:signal transduction histidine kinase
MADAVPPPPSPGAKRRDPKGFLGVAALTGLLLAPMMSGWLLAEGLFRIVDRPPAPVAYLIAVALGLCLCGVIAFVASLADKRTQPNRWTIGEQLLEALDSIRQGDFNVRIENAKRGPFTDVVDSVNSMARDLGTLEQQRQDFISNVSHEIQSPLTSITGFASLLREPGLDESTRRHYLDIIAAESRRLSQLSTNLLRLTALDDAQLDRRRFSLDGQLRDVILTLEPQWSAREVTVELDAPAARAMGDPEILRQVWVNLIQNAIKFTPPGGRVLVQVSPDGIGLWRVDVDDTGEGIAPRDLPHVFERFFRGDKARAVGGNGLGLALAKRIVDLHGGSIAVASEPGTGATFTVRLPLG